MNYLLDKKNKNKKFFKIIIFIVILFILFYFWAGVLNGLSSATHFIFRPILSVSQSIGNKVSNIGLIFHNRKSLLLENENLIQCKLIQILSIIKYIINPFYNY